MKTNRPITDAQLRIVAAARNYVKVQRAAFPLETIDEPSGPTAPHTQYRQVHQDLVAAVESDPQN